MRIKQVFEILRKPKMIFLLLYLEEHRSGSIGELRKNISKSPNLITKYVNELEGIGFVKSKRIRTKSLLEARVVEITEKGEKFLDALKEFLEKSKDV